MNYCSRRQGISNFNLDSLRMMWPKFSKFINLLGMYSIPKDNRNLFMSRYSWRLFMHYNILMKVIVLFLTSKHSLEHVIFMAWGHSYQSVFKKRWFYLHVKVLFDQNIILSTFYMLFVIYPKNFFFFNININFFVVESTSIIQAHIIMHYPVR